MDKDKAIRFWDMSARYNWTKLCIKEGEKIHNHHSESTEEGYKARAILWEREGDIIRRTTIDDGRDCEGRLTHTYVDIVHLNKISSIEVYEITTCPNNAIQEFKAPEWEDEKEYQRDYAAEAAGY